MLKIMKHPDETALEGHARRWLNRTGEDGGYDNGAAGAYRDLMQGGCQAGTVGHLIYYSDTLPFYKKHQTEIGQKLGEMCESCGCGPAELLRDFDKDDPMAVETINQNLLAWFGFEEAARVVIDRAGIED
jgi:hypothetical protein